MKLTYKNGKAGKIHICVDGEYFSTVDEAYFSSLYLKNGQEVDCDELLHLKALFDSRRAYNCAVSLLSRRDHSEKELTDKLRLKGYAQGAHEAVSKLREQGYIDDGRFAAAYVRELVNVKKYGKKRIEQELYKKGIDRETIREAIENTEFSDEMLTDIIKRKYLRYLSDEKGVRKTVNALLRLGYSYSEIRAALNEINIETDSEV